MFVGRDRLEAYPPVFLALRLLETWDGLPRFPRPRHRLRINLSHFAPDRGDRYQRLVGARSFSPIRSTIFPAQLSGTSAQFVPFSCCHPLMHFWLCRHATGIEFQPTRWSSHDVLCAPDQATCRIRNGKAGPFKKDEL